MFLCDCCNRLSLSRYWQTIGSTPAFTVLTLTGRPCRAQDIGQESQGLRGPQTISPRNFKQPCPECYYHSGKVKFLEVILERNTHGVLFVRRSPRWQECRIVPWRYCCHRRGVRQDTVSPQPPRLRSGNTDHTAQDRGSKRSLSSGIWKSPGPSSLQTYHHTNYLKHISYTILNK